MIYVQMPGRWIEESRRLEIYPTEIIAMVSAYYGIKIQEIISKRRVRKYVMPRNIAFWLIRKHTQEDYIKMSKRFGYSHHTTAMLGVKQIDDFIKIYPSVKVDIENLDQRIQKRIK